jgi:hypothetical protein
MGAPNIVVASVFLVTLTITRDEQLLSVDDATVEIQRTYRA